MSRAFEAIDASLKISESVLQLALCLLERAQAAVELRVGELDHRLCFGGGAFDVLIVLHGGAGEFFPRLRDALSDEPDLVLRGFKSDVEMTTRLDVCRRVPFACGGVVPLQLLEHRFEIVVSHGCILPRDERSTDGSARRIISHWL